MELMLCSHERMLSVILESSLDGEMDEV